MIFENIGKQEIINQFESVKQLKQKYTSFIENYNYLFPKVKGYMYNSYIVDWLVESTISEEMNGELKYFSTNHLNML